MRFAILACSLVLLPMSACAQDKGSDAYSDAYSDIASADTANVPRLAERAAKGISPSVRLAREINSVSETQQIAEATQRAALTCTGVAQQGGAVLCQTTPNARVKVARSENDFYFEKADATGRIIIGFDRDETRNFIETDGERVTFDLAAREYDISRIDGLPPSQVSSFNAAQLERIRSASARKKVGFASRAHVLGFKDGFISPVKDYRKTTNFGAQRILNGESKRPHYGVDMAAPVGTPIYAPADGIVSLADDDLYFEGAMVMLDHGQGLISMYLHTDSILVEAGQQVSQGEQIATIGSKGRSTGPHLCWRLKWRNRNLDPELLTHWPNQQHEDHEH